MDVARKIIAREGQALVSQSGRIIASDIKRIIYEEQEFPGDEVFHGTPTKKVRPLTLTRQRVKQAKGYPSTPRIKTGGLVGGIQATVWPKPLTSTIGPSISSLVPALGQQRGTGEPWTDEFGQRVNQDGKHPTPARPFIGISDVALSNIESAVRAAEQRIVASLDKITLSPITLNA
jgi:hypothetical protein